MNVPLEEYLRRASEAGATTLLLMPDQRPIYRKGRELQPPLADTVLTVTDTIEVADAFLTDNQRAQLQEGHDHVERPFVVGTVSGRLTLFLGLGVPHLVFHLDPPI